MPDKPTKLEIPRLTGLKKRQQIEIAARMMFIWVAIAAVAVSFCAATGQYLFSKWLHNNRVISAKSQASATLSQNLVSIQTLIQEVDALVASNDLASVKTNPTDANTKSVLDALPSAFDSAALGTSLQQAVLNRSGVVIENIVVPKDTESTAIPIASTPQEMKFSFIISGSYEQVNKAIVDIEHTIRPIKITSMSLTGTDIDLRASVEAVTYYQPAKSVMVTEEVVQ